MSLVTSLSLLYVPTYRKKKPVKNKDVIAAILYGKPGASFGFSYSDPEASTTDLTGLDWPASGGAKPLLATVEGWDTARRTAESTNTTNEATIRQRLKDGLVTVDTHIANMSAASPTQAQQKAAVLFCLRGLKQLTRLELHQLDSAD